MVQVWMLSDEWLPKYRLLENFNIKWNGNWNGNGNAHGNGNAYDRGDYNSSFALRAVELKKVLNKPLNIIIFANIFLIFRVVVKIKPIIGDVLERGVPCILYHWNYFENYQYPLIIFYCFFLKFL